MANFSRSWRLLQLLFPGAFEQGTPRSVSPEVQPIWDAFRLHIGECFIQSLSRYDVGAGVSLDQTYPEPERNRIFVPLSLVGYQDTSGGVAQVAHVYLTSSGNTPDAWGAWAITAPSLAFNLGGISCAQGVARRLPVISFIPRGNILKVQWQGAILNSNVRTDFAWLNCPGEIVSVLPFNHEGSPG